MEQNCTCDYCKKPVLKKGECPRCGDVKYVWTVKYGISRFILTITDKYLIFVKNDASSGWQEETRELSPGETATANGISILFSVLGSSRVDLTSGKTGTGVCRMVINRKKVGYYDIGSLSSATVYIPASVSSRSAVRLGFCNGAELFLILDGSAQHEEAKSLAAALMPIASVSVVECAEVKEPKCKNPLVGRKELDLTVSPSAAEFIEPFKGMRIAGPTAPDNTKA